MTRLLMAGAAALAIAAFSTGSYAVDVTNQDSQSHFITTFNSDDGAAREYEIGAGQTIKDVCSDCTLVLGKDVKMLTDQPSLSTHEPQHALIKDGKFMVR